jgi:hypothetical protein
MPLNKKHKLEIPAGIPFSLRYMRQERYADSRLKDMSFQDDLACL